MRSRRPVSSAISVFGSGVGIVLIILGAALGTRILFNLIDPDAAEVKTTTEFSAPPDSASIKDSASRHPPKSRRTHPDGLQARMRSKLNEIIIPVIDFEDTTVEEALDFLRQRSRELDPDPNPVQRGVGMVIRNPRVDGRDDARHDESLDTEGGLSEFNPPPLLLNYRAQNVPFWDALEEVARQANMNLSIEEFPITLTPRP